MKKYIVVLLLVLLAGCATAPEYANEDGAEWEWVWRNAEAFRVMDLGNGYYYFEGYGKIPLEFTKPRGQI